MQSSHHPETEEYQTCLHIQLYHPLQAGGCLYTLLPLNQRLKQPAEDPLRLGRDEEACTFALADRHVSRKQLAIQAYRSPGCSELLFQLQNLSQRGVLWLNGARLEYLHWAPLPGKALIRFGEYQLLVCREAGEAQSSFEVEFRVARRPPCQESVDSVPCGVPVTDEGDQLPLSLSHPPQIPLETDEEMYLS